MVREYVTKTKLLTLFGLLCRIFRLFNTDVNELSPRRRLEITTALKREMIEIFSGRNVFGNGSFTG